MLLDLTLVESITMTDLVQQLANELAVRPNQVEAAIRLIDEGASVPFIARYRKERTGNLDEVQLGEIVKYKEQFEALEKRKVTILKALEEQEVLTVELQKQIENTTDATALEDLYLPYKKTRKTKADTAREQGLEPLAKIIMAQNTRDLEQAAGRFLNNEVASIEEALERTDFGEVWNVLQALKEQDEVIEYLKNELER